MVNEQTRRSFLRTAPLAAAVTLSLADTDLLAALTPAAAAQGAAPEPFQLFPAQLLEGIVRGLEASPGNKELLKSASMAFSVTFTSEQKKAGKEFEYHEGRSHFFHILDGTTTYELGGTPQSPRSTAPHEWLAPSSPGSSTITLSKGDVLVIPRGTPHRRTTADTVTFTLISIETTPGK